MALTKITGNVIEAGAVTSASINIASIATAIANDGLVANSSGIFVNANSGLSSNSSGTFVVGGTGVTSNATGIHIGQDVSTTSDVTFGNVSSSAMSVGPHAITANTTHLLLGSVKLDAVDTAIANLVASAPGTLDTLNEIATALGSDPDLANTLTTSIATKATIANPTFTGSAGLTAPSGNTARFTVTETSGATTAMDARGTTGNIGTRTNHNLGFLVNDIVKATLTPGGDFTVTNDLKLTTTNPRIDYDGGSSGALRFFSTSAGEEKARISSDGTVYIGNTTTAADGGGMLYVRADSASYRIGGDHIELHRTSTYNGPYYPYIEWRDNGGNRGGYLGWGNYDAVNGNGSTTNKYVGLYLENSNDFCITGGSVGIGTDDPTYTLHVNSGADNVVADFQSTDSVAAIRLRDNSSNVELQYTGASGAFQVNHGGSGNISLQTSYSGTILWSDGLVHTDTDTNWDLEILNTTTTNKGPRVRIKGAGQNSSITADVPWDAQQGYDIGSIWFDSSEGPGVLAAGIAATAEQDWNTNDTPSALAFYTTPDLTGATTNSAKERLRISSAGISHFSPTESDTRIYLGSQGGLFGQNSSNWVRASGSNMMYNAGGGAHIWEVGGAQRLSIAATGVLETTTAGSGDGYDIIARSTDGGDPGLELTRNGVVGFGIAVRAASPDYADFQLNADGSPSYGETGKMRLYADGSVSIPGTALWSSSVGNILSNTGSHYMVRTSNNIGDESMIINNTTSGGSIGILQYRISAGVQGQYLIGQSGTGITFTGSSDYRLKENVSVLTESSLDKINQLRLVSYNWNEHSDMPTDTTEIGVIAHEIEEVFPEFVDGEKDAVYTQADLDARGDPETTNEEVGDIKAQTVSLLNKDMIIHILKAIQELKAENDSLKARIEALEG